MKTAQIRSLVLLLAGCLWFSQIQSQDYTQYHEWVIRAEEYIASEEYSEALREYDQLFGSYDFIFRKDYLVAAQLALQIDDHKKAFKYLEAGMAAGWKKKWMRKNKSLRKFRTYPEWKGLKKRYRSIREKYEMSLDRDLRRSMKKMIGKDQRKAMGALIRIGQKRKQRYAERRFAPHSEEQLLKLLKLLENSGYPGEKLIGTDVWTSTILSHHNSISPGYAEKDTLYSFVNPLLKEAIERGEMSPYEFALIDDWYIAVRYQRNQAGYGFLDPTEVEASNILRNTIGMRSVELHNKLVNIEERTGMDLFLGFGFWGKGRIRERN